jgi:hypothetical protein
MRVAAFCLLVFGLSQTLHGQQEAAPLSPPLRHPCTIGSVPELEKSPSPQLQAKLDGLRHRVIFGCARAGHLEWAEEISFPEAKTAAQCQDAKQQYPRPGFPPLQPLRIEEASYSSDPWGRVVVLFRLLSGRRVKLTFPPDDRAWLSDDPLPILAYESGLYLDPYNSPFTAAEVESIQHKDFEIGTRREVLDCAKGWDAGDFHPGPRKSQWWILDDRAYRFDSNGRVAEIRDAKNLKP